MRRALPLSKLPSETQTIFVCLLGRNRPVTLFRKFIKNVYLRVSREGAITLSVPKRTSEEKIERFLSEKRRWLERQLAKRENRENPSVSPTLADGSFVFFLGQKRVLRREKAAKNETRFFDDPYEIRLRLKDPTDDAVAHRVFKESRRLVLEDLLCAYVDRWMPVFEKRKVARPEIRIRAMRSLWGSCAYKKAKITLNENLIQTDPKAIEYVVLHELTHFLYHGHDAAFYGFLSACMPDWKARKKLLNGER